MTTYGSTPGVKLQTESGTITGVTIGREQYHILVGVGGVSDAGSADVNDPVRIEGQNDAETKFGAESDLANATDRALNNGSNPDFLTGVKAATSETTETVPSTGTLADVPLLLNTDRISAETATGGSTLTPEFRFADPLPEATNGEVYINPYTGAINADTSEDVSVTYEHADWAAAFDSIENYLEEGEFATIEPITSASAVVSDLVDAIDRMRSDYKMAVGLIAAEYNTTDEMGEPVIDAPTFSSALNNEFIFQAGPTYLASEDKHDRFVGALSAVGGIFAGNPNDEPIYDDVVQVDSLYQGITKADVGDLRGEYVIPVRDTGVVTIEDNHSTYDQMSDGGWERDYFKRRTVDLTVVNLFFVANRQIGGVLTNGVVDDVGEAVRAELDDLVDDGLLQPNGQEAQASREDSTTIGLDVSITPFGVAKAADVTLAISA
jgi:hypothetical protein